MRRARDEKLGERFNAERQLNSRIAVIELDNGVSIESSTGALASSSDTVGLSDSMLSRTD